jgi:hypothetical protein
VRKRPSLQRARTGACGIVVVLLALVLAGCSGAEPVSPSSAPPSVGPSQTRQAGATAQSATPQPARVAFTPTQAPPSATPQPTRAALPPTQAPPLVPPSRTPRATTPATSVATRSTGAAATAAPAAGESRKLPAATPGPDRSRVCVGIPRWELADYDWGNGLPGLYLAFRFVPDPPDTGGVRFAQLVRTVGDAISPSLDELRAAARRHPGSLWFVGNEPDVVLQDNATPEQYARNYGLVYQALKEADPSAQVAIAGVSQPTPLRMAYLDQVLDAYRRLYGTEMPVDIWNVHAYILREERNSWGVGIPPGMPVDQGLLYEIKDHADMAIFRRQIADFRRWMADRGQRDKPLIVSEYGTLMPEDYGFPAEVVSRFMVDTFDYFLTARDPQTGYPADDNRLVQTFCWFSAATLEFPSANLFDPVTRAITPVGKVFRAYVSALK